MLMAAAANVDSGAVDTLDTLDAASAPAGSEVVTTTRRVYTHLRLSKLLRLVQLRKQPYTLCEWQRGA